MIRLAEDKDVGEEVRKMTDNFNKIRWKNSKEWTPAINKISRGKVAKIQRPERDKENRKYMEHLGKGMKVANWLHFVKPIEDEENPKSCSFHSNITAFDLHRVQTQVTACYNYFCLLLKTGRKKTDIYKTSLEAATEAGAIVHVCYKTVQNWAKEYKADGRF